MNPLAVIPSFMTKSIHLEALRDTCLSIVNTTTPEERPDVIVVDDCSPDEVLWEAFEEFADSAHELTIDTVRKDENSGFSRTVNIGLRRARDEGRDAILINADIEMDSVGWVKKCQDTDAALVGALLVYPQSGLIQHAGIYFSFLTRRFYERFKYAPANLPEALLAKSMPCTGAFQYIRAQALTDVGLYDERFRLGYEDVDYSIRVFKADLECAFNPEVRAWHHESMIRGEKNEKVSRWEAESWHQFVRKYAGESFVQYVPAVL